MTPDRVRGGSPSADLILWLLPVPALVGAAVSAVLVGTALPGLAAGGVAAWTLLGYGVVVVARATAGRRRRRSFPEYPPVRLETRRVGRRGVEPPATRLESLTRT